MHIQLCLFLCLCSSSAKLYNLSHIYLPALSDVFLSSLLAQLIATPASYVICTYLLLLFLYSCISLFFSELAFPHLA